MFPLFQQIRVSILLSFLFKPLFRMVFSFIYIYLCFFIFKSIDYPQTILLSFSNASSDQSLSLSSSTSSGESASLSSFPLSPEEQQEDNIPAPNQAPHNHNRIPSLPLGDFIPVPPLDVVDQFRLQNIDQEMELIARIRLLEGRSIEGLPPQLDFGEYETLCRHFIKNTLSIAHYSTTIQQELFEITVYELKADLVEQLNQIFLREPAERLAQILEESPYKQRDIQREALEFIDDKLDVLSLTDPGSHLEKFTLTTFLRYWLRYLQQDGDRSPFYQEFLKYFRGK